MKIARIRGTALLPVYSSKGAACFDLFACLPMPVYIEPGESLRIPTGLVFEIPEGFYVALHSRSGHGVKYNVRLANCTGIIDSDYRGEIIACLYNDGDAPFMVANGDKIVQGVMKKVERVEFEEIEYEDLSKTERGDGGFGSTGR